MPFHCVLQGSDLVPTNHARSPAGGGDTIDASAKEFRRAEHRQIPGDVISKYNPALNGARLAGTPSLTRRYIPAFGGRLLSHLRSPYSNIVWSTSIKPFLHRWSRHQMAGYLPQTTSP